jgi:hypothetical protein
MEIVHGLNEMPKPLTRKGQKAYRIIKEWLTKKCGGEVDTGGCKTFHSPKEWTGTYGQESLLVVVYEGGDGWYWLSMDGNYEMTCMVRDAGFKDRNPYPVEEVQALLRAEGMYMEECTGCYSAVYEI